MTGLRSGAAMLLALTACCVLGPLLMPVQPEADPVHAALLGPGARATALELAEGRWIVAPADSVTFSGGTWLVSDGRTRGMTLDAGDVVCVRSLRFLLGTDRFGRDVLVLMLTGGRLSLLIAGLSVIVALIVGGGVGLLAATCGQVVDALLMRTVDGLLAFPVLFLMILVAALCRPGPGMLVVVLGLTSWMGLARVVRGQVLSLRSRGFVLAARACGSPWYAIWRRHYLPHIVGPVAQDTALRMGDLIIAEATLSYLGLGVPPNNPTWGSMIAEGHLVMLDAWWLATLPGVAIALAVIALALIGDGIQSRVAIGEHA
jgi:peptide/nickel transport system permease protein